MKTPAAEILDPDSGAGLSFNWKRGKFLSFKLLFFIFLSFLAHAFCFYLFQVVYPPSERVTPAPARITLLSPNDARSREMLREVGDRVVYFDTSNRDSAGGRSVEAVAVPFRPSYANYNLELARVAPSRRDVLLPAPFEARPVLPEAGGGADADRGAVSRLATDGTPRFLPGESAADRPVVARGNWDWAIERRSELEGRRAVLMVAVTERGIPQHVLVNEGIESSIDARIVATAQSMRFETATGAGLQWVTLRLQW